MPPVIHTDEGPVPTPPHRPPFPMRVASFVYACGQYAEKQDALLAGSTVRAVQQTVGQQPQR